MFQNPNAPLFQPLVLCGVVLALIGCTTVSRRVLFKGDGIVITQTNETDYALKLSGHGGYILVNNSASIYGKHYSILAGKEPCVFSVPERNLIFFVCLVEKPDGVITPERELHVVNTKTHNDVSIFIGRSKIGNDFGCHKPGSKFSEHVEFENDVIVKFITYDGITSSSRTYPPRNRRIFIINMAERKLVSDVEEPLSKE